eukprot:NODE_3127_length_702_cov_198.834609_g2216_i0.p1 GENE.NODE_3127_length_702_cov_198.834609_g2216_i0~~NODE_3127_length_702_cov_198.834609_g2216_i0.p1  ORF type:complete len:116 (-),score=33.56 NODE_3127_length_702_cov_198.834609_g2216_i0:287-634(-)
MQRVQMLVQSRRLLNVARAPLCSYTTKKPAADDEDLEWLEADKTHSVEERDARRRQKELLDNMVQQAGLLADSRKKSKITTKKVKVSSMDKQIEALRSQIESLQAQLSEKDHKDP